MFVNLDHIIFLWKWKGLKFFLKILHKMLTLFGLFAKIVALLAT